MENMKVSMSRILDTEYSLKRKLVSRNSKNCYISTSLSSCNTSRKDGLFVCKSSSLTESYQVLLSHIDEVIMNNACFYELGFHKYPDAFQPKGLKYILDIEQEPHIAFTYAVGNIVLKKELILAPDKAELLCKYTLLESCNEIDLVLKPFLAFRNVYSLTNAASKQFEVEYHNNRLRISQSKDYPEMFFNFSKKIIFTEASDWYYNFEYIDDKEKGTECKEDLFLPGQIIVNLKENESFVISVGLEKIENYENYKNNYQQNVRQIDLMQDLKF